jgi:hypothetical protein
MLLLRERERGRPVGPADLCLEGGAVVDRDCAEEASSLSEKFSIKITIQSNYFESINK